MIFRFEKTNEKEEIVAYAKTKNALINSIENLCAQYNTRLIGYKDGIVKELNPLLIECFYTYDDKIYASLDGEKYQVKKRLYELSEILETFIYINQGCLANMNLVDHFDASIGGTLLVVFKSGYKDYVSRRQLKNVKERIGMK